MRASGLDIRVVNRDIPSRRQPSSEYWRDTGSTGTRTHPELRPAPRAISRPPNRNAARKSERHFVCLMRQVLLQQARAARPFVFGAEHGDRDFGRVGVSDDAVLIEIVGGFLDFD